MGAETFIGAAATASAGIGMWLLHAAWLSPGRWGYVPGGWTLIVGAILAWSFTSGADKGAALGFIVIVLIALGFLLANALRSDIRPDRSAHTQASSQGGDGGLYWQTIMRRVWIGLLIGPLAGLASLSIATAAFVVLQATTLEHTANLTIVSFGLPLVWAALAVYIGYDTRLVRKSVAVLGGGLLPLAYLMAVS